MFSMPVNAPDEKGPILIYRSDESSPLPDVIPFEKRILPGKAADIVVPLSASPYGYGFVARTGSDPGRRSSESVSVLLMSADGQKLGLLQFSNGPSYGADVINSVTTAWLIATIFAMAIAGLTGWFMSKRVTRPVMALEQATKQMQHGDLSVRVDLPNEKQHEFLSLADSFNGMAEQVEQTVSTLRAFVADAAHELHTPLTALQANIELARDEKNVSEQVRYLSRAKEQGLRLEALVQSLLDLSRIEAAESRTNFVPVDLARLLRERSEPYASRAEQMEREFRLSVDEGSALVIGNESQLGQVVDNLLDNAFKFTPKNGAISVSLEQTSNEVKLKVSDTGIGIPAEDLPHIFERFHRARNVAEYQGNGLGLAIVKAIVRAHGGDIQAGSDSMQGTTFVASLPLHKPKN
jgi:signal transduction histidine kinase